MNGAFAALLGAMASVTAQAAEISGNIGAHFDYVDRGLSLAREEGAASAALYADFRRGFWFGATALRVDAPDGSDENFALAAGRTYAFDAYELDLSLSLDAFVGGRDFLYPELRARLSRDLGLLKATAGLAYAPDGRWFVRNEQTLYGYVEAEVPVPRVPWLTIVGHAGYETISDAADKADWGLGLAAGWSSFELSLGYEDSDRDIRIGRARFTASLRLFF